MRIRAPSSPVPHPSIPTLGHPLHRPRATGEPETGIPDEVVTRIEDRRVTAHRSLTAAVDRRERAYTELVTSPDPVDQAIARVYRDFLLQVEEVERSEAAMLLAAGIDGRCVIGRVAVFDDDRELLVIPWHASEGQRQLTAPERLMITERGDAPLTVHRLTADARALASRIRHGMRTAARREEMSDPLATLTTEQGAALAAIAAADNDVVLTGPPGSGKSAIVLVELARRVLSHPEPHTLRVLFVTGTPQLAQRAVVLGRLLGVASITPVPQNDLSRTLGVAQESTPVAGHHPGADGAHIPRALESRYGSLRGALASSDPIPHPLGPTDPQEVAAVRRWRARSGTASYTVSARQLRRDLIAEYENIWPGSAAAACARSAADQLRPVLTPTELVRQALPGMTLPRPLHGTATAYARSLLETPPRQSAATWDLVLVDEYQRLPALLLWHLRRCAGELLLSGDPHQAFTHEDVRGTWPLTDIALVTSLRLPAVLAAWIDDVWLHHGLRPPRIVSAADGGTVRSVAGAANAPPAGVQVIAPASFAERREDWLSPLDALGLEWPEVVLVEPELILREHGAPGLFVAATRAIDTLTLDRAADRVDP